MSTNPRIAARFSDLFDVLDTDGDKSVTWDDYQRLVDRYVSGYGLEAQAPRALAIREAYEVMWRKLAGHEEAGDGRLDREAFVAAMQAASEDRSRSNAAEAVAEAVFDLLDADEDGRISEEEFLVYAKALGAEESGARKRFAHVDTDGDAFVSREEFVLSARLYLFGDDIDSPGGFVFGVV
ncbi:calcium-binding protein [Nocardiopsis terrae]|uniref:Ca2+-binding EF-hand superfamily protein n=1 Tax=Nocardiopsis terrae TaxID=372655 RepID=A0ABR9HBY2_9ACTN|nr:EF-hand domain-containing protein [Nocardiopsis terrae]MBE1456527.1 Ca2+-binding EF-hand superfamily protein [Nocardiopsis terrae]GHC76377.1 calcium-binding protein [Nocardiopsis terrae]